MYVAQPITAMELWQRRATVSYGCIHAVHSFNQLSSFGQQETTMLQIVIMVEEP